MLFCRISDHLIVERKPPGMFFDFRTNIREQIIFYQRTVPIVNVQRAMACGKECKFGKSKVKLNGTIKHSEKENIVELKYKNKTLVSNFTMDANTPRNLHFYETVSFEIIIYCVALVMMAIFGFTYFTYLKQKKILEKNGIY